MKRVTLISLSLITGAGVGVICGKVLDDFLLASVAALLCGLVVGYIGGYVIDRTCDEDY